MEIKIQKLKEAGMSYAKAIFPAEKLKENKAYVISLQNAFVSGARWLHEKTDQEIQDLEQDVFDYAKDVKRHIETAEAVNKILTTKFKELSATGALKEVYELLNQIKGKEVNDGAVLS